MSIIVPGMPSNQIPRPIYGSGNGPSDPANGGFTAPPRPRNMPITNSAPKAPTARLAKMPTGLKGPAPKPKPKPLSALQKWLAGDTTYQQQLAEFNKSRGDYQATYNKQVGITNRDYNETQRELNLQGQKDRMDQQNDFAGRGILHSGVYAQALGDYNTDFNTKLHNLTTGETDKLGDLADQRGSFLRELQLQLNAAKQEAIRRRAQQLGL